MMMMMMMMCSDLMCTSKLTRSQLSLAHCKWIIALVTGCVVSDTCTSVVVVGEVESGYHRANAYHNAVHATDVTQAMNCYINEQKVCSLLCCSYCLTIHEHDEKQLTAGLYIKH